MITKNGPKVIEYNCRFGDPETQVVLPLLKTDLLDVMMAVSEERLSEINVEFSDEAACCVIMASKGYPEKYDKGFEINIPEEYKDSVYVAGASLKDGRLVTSGGRVLGVTSTAEDLDKAISESYDKISKISFANAYFRSDIGARALACFTKGK
jgi:phosphoribosylamine--glycine ligase